MYIDTAGNIGVGQFAVENKLEIAGATVVGLEYTAFAGLAPEDGMLIQGNVGIGTQTPQNRLDVEGGLAVGANYSGAQLAPPQGLLVEGRTGLGTVSPHSRLHVNGAVATPVGTYAGDVTLNDSHSVVLVDASGGTRTVTLPSAVGIAGRQYTIKKIDATNFGVVIDPEGVERIEGLATHTLIGQWRYASIVSDGIGWLIVGNN